MPIVMEGVNVEPEINFKLLVDTFCLTVSLGMVCCGRGAFDPTSFIETGDELVHELRSVVTSDCLGNAKMTDPVMDQDVSVTLRGQRCQGGDEDGFLGSLVDDDENGIETVRDGKRGYKVDRDILERGWAWVNWVKGSFGFVSMWFVGLTGGASFNVQLYVGSHRVSVVVTLD